MHYHPTKHQGGDMLQCAKEVTDRASGRHLSYPEFCSYPKELKRTNDRSHQRQLGKIPDRNGLEKKKKSRKMSKSNVTHDVFLGGSCNPTTWRHDIAIPLLEQHGISYYNPQVSEWSADLIAVEHRAKANAKILFYVLDSQTRNVVGIVEAAHFAGCRRNLVLVIDQYQQDQRVAGEIISNREFDELSGGLATLQDLLQKQGILIFNNISVAVQCTAKLLLGKHNDRGAKLRSSQKIGHTQIKLKEVFDALDSSGSGEINVNDFCMAYRLLTNRNLSLSDLNGILGERKDDNKDFSRINFDQFHKMVHELKIQNGMIEKWIACCSKVAANNALQLNNLDIYIGGSCFDYTWKQFAIPMLENSGLKYRFAECSSQSSSRAGETEIEAMENSSILLFVITNNTRGLETMALASYYIGLGRNVILCIQQLTEGCTIGNEKLTEIAINDYNRGRFYLADEARRRKLPVFHSVSDAVQCAVDKCLNNSTTSRR